MKILTYKDYLNSTLTEIEIEIQHSYMYNKKESQNFIKFMDMFSKEIGKYENIIQQIEPEFIQINKHEKCIDTLNRYKMKAREFTI